jgi:hypothetical protein
VGGVFVSFGVKAHSKNRVLEAQTLARNITTYQLTHRHRTEGANRQQDGCNRTLTDVPKWHSCRHNRDTRDDISTHIISVHSEILLPRKVIHLR